MCVGGINMRKTKKKGIEKLEFYTVSEEYVEYLSRYDKHIAYNKLEKRPYIGVVLEVRNKHYFAPMFSPKNKHKSYKENFTFFRMWSNNKKSLGVIRFSDMIPVPLECVQKFDIDTKRYGYKRLIEEQYSYINISSNVIKIKEKASSLYDMVVSDENSNKTRFYKKLSCNFKVLEEKCKEYEHQNELIKAI